MTTQTYTVDILDIAREKGGLEKVLLGLFPGVSNQITKWKVEYALMKEGYSYNYEDAHGGLEPSFPSNFTDLHHEKMDTYVRMGLGSFKGGVYRVPTFEMIENNVVLALERAGLKVSTAYHDTNVPEEKLEELTDKFILNR
ncbi:MAG: hypothetical protein HGA85_07845 [Nanoarchaeota archaeon]|nr:hypothetical protein [Nanoarchaeota archaeon]